MSLAIGIPFGIGFRPYTARPGFAIAGASFAVDFLQQLVWVESTAGQGVVQSVASATTFTRASDGTYENAAGNLATAGTDVLRYSYSADEPIGALIEGSRTNSIRNPRCEGASAPSTLPTYAVLGTLTNCSVTVVGSGVENGIEYLEFTVTATGVGGGRLQFDNPSWGASSPFVLSAYASRVSGSMAAFSTFNLRAVELPSSTITSVNILGVAVSALRTQRFSVAATSTAGAASLRCETSWVCTSAGSVTLRIGLPQLELGGGPSSPIRPPVASPAATTRANESLTASVGSWFNTSVGTLLVGFDTPYAITTPARLVTIDDGTTSNRIFISSRASNGQFSCSTSGGGSIDLGAFATGRHKIAYSWEANNLLASIDGATALPDTSSTIPTGLTTIRFGRDSSGDYAFGWLRRVVYLPRASTGAELQALSG